jgi:alkylation response protein AidB-like acyl-CoA dehydrogenase
MNLTFDSTEADLQQELRRFLVATIDADRRRAIAAQPGAVDRELWTQLADMGVFSISLPEEAGGIGLGLAHAAIVFEELGRALVPGPLVGTYLAAGHVAGAATGDAVVGMQSAGYGGVIEHRDALDHLLVVDDAGMRLSPVPTGGRLAPRPLDPLTPVHLDCDVAREPGDSVTLSDDVHTAQAARIDAQTLIAAFQVGLAQGAVELGSAYAQSRQQFGRVIGSFQAVKHLLVDAVVGTEVARAGVHAAAVTIDEDRADTDRPPSIRSDDRLEQIAAGARVVASRAAHGAATACIQVHGGIGYTWELEAHLYLKRSLVLDELLGGFGEAIDLVAASV